MRRSTCTSPGDVADPPSRWSTSTATSKSSSATDRRSFGTGSSDERGVKTRGPHSGATVNPSAKSPSQLRRRRRTKRRFFSYALETPNIHVKGSALRMREWPIGYLAQAERFEESRAQGIDLRHLKRPLGVGDASAA